jgi:preprotein translocase subunit SecF
MIRFSKYIWLYLLISGAVLVPGIFSLVRWGLKPSIDFAGGTLLELKFAKAVSQNDLEKAAQLENLSFTSIAPSGGTTYLLQTKSEESIKITGFIARIEKSASASATIVRQDTVGPVLGRELLVKAIIAAILAIMAILLYVAYAFKNFTFGIAAIVSLVHDLLVMLGTFSLFGHFFGVEIDTLYVTAFLTTMSFSVHDTIVILDRVREYQKKDTTMKFVDVCDRALTETMGRSLVNSMTIIIMLVALVLMGGSTIRWFSIALLIGTISGTYSSPFVATPTIILWKRWQGREKRS